VALGLQADGSIYDESFCAANAEIRMDEYNVSFGGCHGLETSRIFSVFVPPVEDVSFGEERSQARAQPG
jgi:hypothetical protein